VLTVFLDFIQKIAVFFMKSFELEPKIFFGPMYFALLKKMAKDKSLCVSSPSRFYEMHNTNEK